MTYGDLPTSQLPEIRRGKFEKACYILRAQDETLSNMLLMAYTNWLIFFNLISWLEHKLGNTTQIVHA